MKYYIVIGFCEKYSSQVSAIHMVFSVFVNFSG